MGSYQATFAKKTTLLGHVITQVIAIVVFVILPIVITLMVPFSTIVLDKSNGGTTVTVHRYVLVFIPWRTQRIESATGMRADITEEKHYRGTVEERRKGQKGWRLATGQVAIVSGAPDVIVQAAPELAKAIVAQFDRFAAARNAEPVSIQVHASWWLSYVLGGVMTALCALYVVGAALAIVTFPFKRRASPA